MKYLKLTWFKTYHKWDDMWCATRKSDHGKYVIYEDEYIRQIYNCPYVFFV